MSTRKLQIKKLIVIKGSSVNFSFIKNDEFTCACVHIRGCVTVCVRVCVTVSMRSYFSGGDTYSALLYVL